jgi:hypothetical protein
VVVVLVDVAVVVEVVVVDVDVVLVAVDPGSVVDVVVVEDVLATVDAGIVVDVVAVEAIVVLDAVALVGGATVADVVVVGASPVDGATAPVAFGVAIVEGVVVEQLAAARAGEAHAIAPTPRQTASTTGMARGRARPTAISPPRTASSASATSVIDVLPVAGKVQFSMSSSFSCRAAGRRCLARRVGDDGLLFVGSVSGHERSGRFGVTEVAGLVGHAGGDEQEVSCLVDTTVPQIVAVAGLHPSRQQVDRRFESVVVVGISDSTSGDDHQVHPDRRRACGGTGDADEGRETLQCVDRVGRPDDDDLVVFRADRNGVDDPLLMAHGHDAAPPRLQSGCSRCAGS